MLMQPQQPSPAPPPVDPSSMGPQYDFIMNPDQPSKRSILPTGGSKKTRIIIVAIGAGILLLVTLLIISLISNAGKADTEALVTAAKQQQELIRVAEIGVDKARTQDARNIAVTTKLALQSQQTEMQAAIKTAGLNPKKVLEGTENKKTTEQLTTAEQNNRFDDEFLKVMTASLIAYQKSVKSAYDGATSKKLKTALTTQYKSANTLAGVAAGN